MLYKLSDEGVIPIEWNASHMCIISKNITKEIYYDCVKEESEIVEQISDFGKYANKVTMQIVRNILNKKIY